MFGRHFELPAYMMLAELAEEIPLFVSQQIVETDPGSYEHLLHAGDVPKFFQESDIITVIRIQVPAGRWKQALSVPADAVFELLFTGGMPEVRSGAAHIVDISLKILFPL